MKRPILIHPDPRLKKACAPVANISDEIRTLAADMLETMYATDEGEPEPTVMVNPEVIGASDDLNTYDEGCLSIPDVYADVTRPEAVRVRWLDLDGSVQERDMDGLWATCVQHEIDHLDGKLFIDYLKPLKRQLITRKMQKLKRELARS